MNQLLTIIMIVRQLAPVIAEAVQLIEQLFPDSGLGGKKLVLLHNLLTSIASNAGIAQEQLTDNRALIENIAGWLVSAYNSLGRFK